MKFSNQDVDYLLSPIAIRERAGKIFELTLNNKTHFRFNPNLLDQLAEYVIDVIRDNYPDLNIPFHARDTHINCGGIKRMHLLEKELGTLSPLEKAKAKLDLILISVLLDAGAGNEWRFKEDQNAIYSRSEGLAVASFHMFMDGAFSKSNELKIDPEGLENLTSNTLKKYFQVTESNPLIGVEGRTLLLNKLGSVLKQSRQVFPTGRMGDIIDILVDKKTNSVQAPEVLKFTLRHLGEIWPSRLRLGEQSLGDVWKYSKIGQPDATSCLVPFHKLSQWLTYSLLTPMLDLGVHIRGVDELTGLAEYRNGGLFIDSGVLTLKDNSLLAKKHAADSDLIIEWRALTIILLDKITNKIRQKLEMTSETLPLVKVLEGGTWHAGRRIAKMLRPSGEPPLNIVSDGTIF